MRGWFMGLLCSLGALVLVTQLMGEPLERELKQNGWHTDYASAREAARRTGKPLFVIFRCQS